MSPALKSITVRDFRSIRGELTIPLDGPVVLIHGQNGAGKTSLLSAIELGLTGRLLSLAKLDANLRDHLVHKDSDEAFVAISVAGLNDCPPVAEITLKPGVISGRGLLTPSLATFYAERCYLAQSTLSRLLEIYQTKEATSNGSPLTLFVKDLLGLDALDALINGLHDGGDVRRLRGGATRYWEVRDQIPAVEDELRRLGRELAISQSQENEIRASVRAQLSPYWQTEEDFSVEKLRGLLEEQSQESILSRVARSRLEAASMVDQWNSLESLVGQEQRERIEKAAQDAQAALRAWLDADGQQLAELFRQLSPFFSDLPSPFQNRPEYARVSARNLAKDELDRCNQILRRDSEAVAAIALIDADVARLSGRLAVIEDQISQHSEQAGQLANALAALLPHVHTDDCPVCGRSFGEVSQAALSSHLTAKISTLTQAAGKLTALSKERSETLVAREARLRDRAAVQGQATPEARIEISTRFAKLSELVLALDSSALSAVSGEVLFEQAARATGNLSALRSRDHQATSFRAAATRFAQELTLEAIDPSEPLGLMLDRTQRSLVATEEHLTVRDAARRKALSTLGELQVKHQSVLDIRARLDARRTDLEQLLAGKAAGDRVISQVRELQNVALNQRTRIVSRVFNESLNAAWRNLFVRLAPDEPFVPAFVLPGTGDAVEAKLETTHRSGSKGGNPRAMLSAGNLNTAALTLFLALHMSVRSPLPWLVIDDPVQSMDEVHISQFAALLRTLTKQHGRQVILAVHEKPLFDYLALELSPSFPGDRLVTVELGRTADDRTAMDYHVRTWAPDLAVAA